MKKDFEGNYSTAAVRVSGSGEEPGQGGSTASRAEVDKASGYGKERAGQKWWRIPERWKPTLTLRLFPTSLVIEKGSQSFCFVVVTREANQKYTKHCFVLCAFLWVLCLFQNIWK